MLKYLFWFRCCGWLIVLVRIKMELLDVSVLLLVDGRVIIVVFWILVLVIIVCCVGKSVRWCF